MNGAGPHGNYGKGAVHDFDNPNKWTTVEGIPVLDEHELTDDDGKVVGYVDRSMLEEIAANNNKRVQETNDPAPLIVGHTSDDPQAPERPVVGYAVNYSVRPYKRDEQGQWRYAIHADYKVRKNKEHVIEDFPRRSVELWLGRKELDPIALLGGTTPERDLGVIIRKSRITGLTIDQRPAPNSVRELESFSGPVLHYRKGKGTVLRYALSDDVDEGDEEPINYSCEGGMKTPSSKNVKPPMAKVSKKPVKAIFERDETGDMDEGDGLGMQDDQMEGLPPGPDGEGSDGYDDSPAEEDPAIAAVFQSKQFKSMLQEAIRSALEGLLAEEEGGAGPGAPGAGGPPPMDADPMASGPMPQGTDGLAPQPEEEVRIDHEAPPVRFNASTGMAGPGNTFEPGMGTKGTRYQRHQPFANGSNTNMNRRTQPARQQADPEVLRLRRQMNDLLIKNARIEAQQTISELMNNVEGHPEGGIEFADPQGEAEMLAAMDPQSRVIHIENIKKNYRRSGNSVQQGPTHHGPVDHVLQYARPQAVNGTGDGKNGSQDADDNYTPANGQEATVLADACVGTFTQGKKMTMGEAVRYCRQTGRIGRRR